MGGGGPLERAALGKAQSRICKPKDSRPGGIDSSESIPGLLQRLQRHRDAFIERDKEADNDRSPRNLVKLV